MKKIALFLLTIALAFLTLTACADPVVPGSAWADKETLTYVAYSVADTDRENPLFDLTAVMENLPKGSYSLSTSDKKYEMGSSARRYTLNATDPSGKQVMYSESLMDVFTPVASYKKVDFNGKNYNYSTEFDGKNVKYTLEKDGETVTDSFGTGKKVFVENELLFSYVRTYPSAESNLNSSVYVADVVNRQLVGVNLQTVSTGENKMSMYSAEPNKVVKTSRVEISRKSSPVGSPIVVNFSLSSGDDAFTFPSTTNSVSKRIPVQIIENDIVYYLVSVSVN